MPNDILTVSDLVADAFDLSDAEVSDLRQEAPLVSRLPAEESSNGTVHSYSKEVGAPVVGFRAANAGRDFDHSEDTVVNVDLKILDFSWLVDKAVADVWRKGGAQAKIAREGARHLAAAMFKYEKQLIYGATALGDTSGFAGLADAATVAAYDDAMVVNAGGTTASTGSSCWGLRLGDNDMLGVYNGDMPFDLGETIVQNFVDGSGKNLPCYYTPGCTWLGMQIGSIHSVGRIINLTEDSGKGLTDDLIAALIAKFPANKGPNVLVMNMRSWKQLQDSRTATTTTGAPAPFPTEAFGVPIVVTDAIVSTEAISA